MYNCNLHLQHNFPKPQTNSIKSCWSSRDLGRLVFTVVINLDPDSFKGFLFLSLRYGRLKLVKYCHKAQ